MVGVPTAHWTGRPSSHSLQRHRFRHDLTSRAQPPDRDLEPPGPLGRQPSPKETLRRPAFWAANPCPRSRPGRRPQPPGRRRHAKYGLERQRDHPHPGPPPAEPARPDHSSARSPSRGRELRDEHQNLRLTARPPPPDLPSHRTPVPSPPVTTPVRLRQGPVTHNGLPPSMQARPRPPWSACSSRRRRPADTATTVVALDQLWPCPARPRADRRHPATAPGPARDGATARPASPAPSASTRPPSATSSDGDAAEHQSPAARRDRCRLRRLVGQTRPRHVLRPNAAQPPPPANAPSRELVRRRRPRRRPAPRAPRLLAPLGLEALTRNRQRPRHLPAPPTPATEKERQHGRQRTIDHGASSTRSSTSWNTAATAASDQRARRPGHGPNRRQHPHLRGHPGRTLAGGYVVVVPSSRAGGTARRGAARRHRLGRRGQDPCWPR